MAEATTTWGVGDYPRMAVELEPVSAAAVASASVGPGVRVLDVASGTGNASLVAAQAGAVVTGVDVEPVLSEIAAERAAAAGLDIRLADRRLRAASSSRRIGRCRVLDLWRHVCARSSRRSTGA